MPNSVGNIGRGTTLSFTPISGSPTLVGEVYDVVPPEEDIKSIDFTQYGSPNYALEFKPGWLDGGSVTFKCNFVSTTLAALRALYQAILTWTIQLPVTGTEATAGGTWSFSGFITKAKQGVPNDNRMTVDVTIKVTGKPAFTPGS